MHRVFFLCKKVRPLGSGILTKNHSTSLLEIYPGWGELLDFCDWTSWWLCWSNEVSGDWQVVAGVGVLQEMSRTFLSKTRPQVFCHCFCPKPCDKIYPCFHSFALGGGRWTHPETGRGRWLVPFTEKTLWFLIVFAWGSFLWMYIGLQLFTWFS